MMFENVVSVDAYLAFILFFISTSAGSVLIFVTKKANSEELAAKLKTKDFEGMLSALSLSSQWSSIFCICQQSNRLAPIQRRIIMAYVKVLERNTLL